MHSNLDFNIILPLIWWFLLGILLIGYAIMDGFDLGVAMILPFAGKTDEQRRVIINTIGPFWEGNQVWLLLGAGAIFAAFAPLYALTFTGFYVAMLLILFGLILRPVAFKYRSKMKHPKLRNLWDFFLFIGGLLPALVTGVAVGNVMLGVPFDINPNNANQLLYNVKEGNLFYLLFNPNGLFIFTLITGLLAVSMYLMHGGNYLALKTEKDVSERAAKLSRMGTILALTLFIISGLLVDFVLKGYTSIPQNYYKISPMQWGSLITEAKVGAWMDNYIKYPFFILCPIFAIIGGVLSYVFNRRKAFGWAFFCSSTSIFGIISTVGTAIFPFFLPSVTNPSASVIIFNAANSEQTLYAMSIAAMIFVPLIIAYTSWVHYVLRGKVKEKDILSDGQSY